MCFVETHVLGFHIKTFRILQDFLKTLQNFFKDFQKHMFWDFILKLLDMSFVEKRVFQKITLKLLVDNFFDNIADYKEDFSFIRNNESAFYFAKKRALENNSNSSTDDNFEDEVNNNQSETTISTDIDAEYEIAQIITTNLSKCIIIDIVDEKLQRCNSDLKLRAGRDLNKLGICYSHFMFDQNQLHEAGAKKEKDIR
ncbi:hypothetical protein C1645_800804 [Glomus cerebriforme]|uniref:Uncharacterized protein n=1 Tax=Glomus cerebriforme TaxID=658196 RepID=A0A397TMA3_9GLOM|nr:hypothetical protein C1645_800804 [Glomus cerebriforme]